MINPDPKMIAQLNLLSDLIGGHTGGSSSKGGLVTLSLFDEEEEDEERPVASKWVQRIGAVLLTRSYRRSQPRSTAAPSRPKNDDVTIDVSKVKIQSTIISFPSSSSLFQRNQNPRLTHVLQDLDFDERPSRRGQRHNDDEEDDLCAMMDRLPDSGNKRR